MINLPRRFHLQRDHDITGASGVGRVADGIQFADGHAALRWRTATNSTAVYDSIDDVIAIHGHDGNTRLVWDDPEDAATAADTVLAVVSRWCTVANEVGGVDAGDLAWDLQEAGYPLPAPTTP